MIEQRGQPQSIRCDIDLLYPTTGERQEQDRGMAGGIQRRTAEQQFGRTDAKWVRVLEFSSLIGPPKPRQVTRRSVNKLRWGLSTSEC